MILLLGCSGGPEGDPALPMTYTPDTRAEATPEFTEAEATTAVATVLGRLLDLQGGPVFAAYDEMIPWADDVCPGPVTSEEGSSLWDTDGCTSASGATFAGFVSSFVDPGGTGSRSMNAEASISSPDGHHLVLAGTTQLVVGRDVADTSDVASVVAYDGPAAVGTWIADGFDLSLALAWVEGASGVTSVEAEGGVGVDLGAVDGVDFIGFSASSERTCPEEPAGRIGLRDPNGGWAEVVFDVSGSDEAGWTVDACDGCGALLAGGVALGQVCVDTTLIFEERGR